MSQEAEKSAESKAETITSKAIAKEAQTAKGLYNVTYLKDHGNRVKGEQAQMHLSTAKALKAHKVVEIGEAVKVVKKVKR
jgi:hypothetical protein